MGLFNSTPRAEGDRQVHSVDTMDYRTIAAKFKRFIETISDQALATESAIKSQNANIEALSSDPRMSPGRTFTHTELLKRSLKFNQDSMMKISRSMVSTVEDFKSASQPVIEAFDSDVKPDPKIGNDSAKNQNRGKVDSVVKSCSGTEATAMEIFIEELQQQLIGMREREDSNNTSLEHKMQECMAMEKEIKILTNDKQFLQRKVEQLQKTNKQTATSGWFSGTSRKTVTAHVYCPRKGDLATSVVSEMSAMLRTQFEMENMDLCLNVVDGADIRSDIPVMVICINASRLGTDASNALSNLPVSRTMSLVILHHKDVHALPSQTSDRVLTAPNYKCLGGIFDMAFLTGKGMYSCDMNNSAVANIVAFIKQHK